jgi:hypothetical protein
MEPWLRQCLESERPVTDLPEPRRQLLAGELEAALRVRVVPASISFPPGRLVFLCQTEGDRRLGVAAGAIGALDGLEQGVEHAPRLFGAPLRARLVSICPASAAWLRRALPHLNARPLGLKRSAGFGDRLGLATPGHVRAVRKTSMAPIFAQQSVRENERTGRSPRQVLDDAMWGAFQEGWCAGFGADADHLKTAEQVAAFAADGYSFFTVDPGEYVDNLALHSTAADLDEKLRRLPWDELETTLPELQRRLAGRPIDLGTERVSFAPEQIARAAAKYGRAVAHTLRLYRRLHQALAPGAFEFEMSVDETDAPTTLAEHVFIASELRRLQVRCVSLAPRYVGAFEKGVDYIGDAAEFERSFAQHVAVAAAFGPYKLSLHSGSDKFSIYPIAARLAGELVHLKTAGTSYLEALRTVGRCAPALFREIFALAVERYPLDRASYHVSAQLAQLPDIAALHDGELPGLLEHFHAREVLHVTYGSVLNDTGLRARFFDSLQRHAEEYTRAVEVHFDRHLSRFA